MLEIVAVVIFLLWAYILFIREWLVSQWPDRFTWWHSVEDWLWLNSRQILIARVYWLFGIILGIHESLAASGFDITPFITQLTDVIPEKWRPMVVPLIIPAFLAATGFIMGWLRRITTEPLLPPTSGAPDASRNLLTDRNVGNQ